MKLVERIINDPNSSFRAEDADELEKLPQDVLQRMAIGLQPQAVTNADSSRENDLREDLDACQKDILELLSTEQSIRKELEGYGGHPVSVLEQFIPVMNAKQAEDLSEENVMDFVKNSHTMTGSVLREALAARESGRAKAIEVIVSNSNLFTEAELRRKFTPELQKLADFVLQARPAQAETTIFNWDGAGLADQSVNQTTVTSYGAPLELPSTFQ